MMPKGTAATGSAAGPDALEQTAGGTPSETSPSRRRALARLGLAAAVAYSAPTVIKIDRSARAIVLPSPCEPPPDFPPGFPPPPCP